MRFSYCQTSLILLYGVQSKNQENYKFLSRRTENPYSNIFFKNKQQRKFLLGRKITVFYQ